MIKKGQRKSLTTTPAKINNVQLLPRRRRNCSRGRGRIAAATPPRPNLGVLLVNPTVKQHQKGEGMGGRKEQKKKRKKTQKIIPKTERYRERKKRKKLTQSHTQTLAAPPTNHSTYSASDNTGLKTPRYTRRPC